MLMLSTGERLRAWRQANRLPAAKVAKLLDVSRVTIWHWERTERQPNKVYRGRIERLITQPYGPNQTDVFPAGERGQAATHELHHEIEVSKERITALAGVHPARVLISISY